MITNCKARTQFGSEPPSWLVTYAYMLETAWKLHHGTATCTDVQHSPIPWAPQVHAVSYVQNEPDEGFTS